MQEERDLSGLFIMLLCLNINTCSGASSRDMKSVIETLEGIRSDNTTLIEELRSDNILLREEIVKIRSVIDADGDGYTQLKFGDCNDSNERIYPGAEVLYFDGYYRYDQNCDGKTD